MILAKRTWTLEQIRSAANEAAKSDGWCYDCHAPVRSGEGHADDCHGGAVQSMLHAFADLLEARAARLSPWQPIETAPKDGTWILAFGSEAYSTPNRIRSMAWFDEGEWGIGWYDDLGEGRFSPTHWQPLPAPPAQDGGRP